MTKTLSIIIPAFNEENTIEKILNKISDVALVQGVIKEMVVVNDCSQDNTEKIIKDYINQHPDKRISLINHEVNKRKRSSIAYRI